MSAVGPAGFLDQKVMIDAAIKAGVQRFLPSELSMNGTAAGVIELVPVFMQKWEVLEYLKAKEASGLSWTGLGTGPLIDWVSTTKMQAYQADVRPRVSAQDSSALTPRAGRPQSGTMAKPASPPSQSQTWVRLSWRCYTSRNQRGIAISSQIR